MDDAINAQANGNKEDNSNLVPMDAIVARADYSLRASGSTYIERGKEAHDIVDRIKTSSASVIGIAGVRGAGKSSLAKKALSECADAGFFTLLIPSPTEYDPKDFLLAIFQRIAEHATKQVQDIIEGAQSLAELGDRQARHLRLQLYLVLSVVLLLSLAVWVANYSLNKAEQQNINQKQLADLKQKQDLVREELSKRDTKIAAPTTPAAKERDKASALPVQSSENYQYPYEIIGNLQNYSLSAFKAKLHGVGTNAALKDVEDEVGQKVADITKDPAFDARPWVIGAASTGFVVLFACGYLGQRIFRRLRIFRRYRKHIGLLQKSQAFMELIRYQSVMASNTEIAFAPKLFSGKLGKSKQLEDRPLSLPGLTANCSEFLQYVAEVFSGRVVICIDELDKITDVTELFRLLKGIKGILGQENTHFMLTVSEDAMAFFNERLSRERSLVESSFEEIVYLDRLTLDLTKKVVRQSIGLAERSPQSFDLNCAVQWIFAGGIPREIKRNLFAAYAHSISMETGSPFDLWKALYLSMLESMQSIAGPKEAAGVEDHYRFLICTEAFVEQVQSLQSPPNFNRFMHDIVGVLRQHFGHVVFRPLLTPQADEHTKSDTQSAPMPTSSIYLPQLVEALIGALVLAVATGDIEDDADQLASLIYVYKYVPINPRYAFYGLNRFLQTRLSVLAVDLNKLAVETPLPKLAVL